MNRLHVPLKSVLGTLAIALAACSGHAIAGTPADERYQELDTPFVTTPTNVMNTMLDLAKVGRGDRLIDLGSGDGRIVITAAKRGATAVGVEIDPRLLQRSRENAKREGVADRATFRDQDLFQTEFKGYDVVTIYLLPDVNRKLAPKLYSTLHPGARIVSHDYDLGDWPPDQTVELDVPDKTVGRDKKSKVFYWLVPARIDGQWKAASRGGRLSLSLKQEFQFVSGSALWTGIPYTVDRQKVTGAETTLKLTAGGRAPLTVVLRPNGEHLVATLQEGAGRPLEIELERGAPSAGRRGERGPGGPVTAPPGSAAPQPR